MHKMIKGRQNRGRRMRRSREREQATRETVGRAWLAWIASHGSPPTQAQLADSLQVSRHAVGRALRYLEVRGVPITSDSRRAKLVLDAMPSDHPAVERWKEVEAIKGRKEYAQNGSDEG